MSGHYGPVLSLAELISGWPGGERWRRQMATASKSVTFETTVAASGNNTGIEVPAEVIEQLAAGNRRACWSG